MSKDPFFERKGWKTSLGFYFAVLFSSFGIINIWRFPYIVTNNGGGAFLFVYFMVAAVLGSCFVMAELMLGKMSQRSLWQALDRWTRDKVALEAPRALWKKSFYKILRRTGETTMIVSFMIAAYYTVISGWVLGYLVNHVISLLAPASLKVTFDMNEDNFFTQFTFSVIHLLICCFYVRRGIRRGLERMAYIVAPVFLILLFFLCFQSLTLPNAMDSLRFLLYPDFTKITASALAQAIGHMVLSLGLGLGTMMTFGSYFTPTRDITSAGSRVVMFSIAISVLSTLIVCPMVLGANYAVFGPKLLFQTLPQLILKFPEGDIFLAVFYLMLYLSSLVASTGLLESIVANLSDRWRWERRISLKVCAMTILFLILFPLLSSTLLRHYRWLGGISLLESLDSLLVDYLLPVLALVVSLAALFLLPNKAVRREFAATEIDQEFSHFFPIWRLVILWVAPILVGGALIMRIVGEVIKL